MSVSGSESNHSTSESAVGPGPVVVTRRRLYGDSGLSALSKPGSPEGAGGAKGPGGAGGAGGPLAATGRRVSGGQAADRRVIALVRARPLLYARTALPVASYYSKVKQLWQEVADHMEWTVAEVRRKWSHIRNSYSRHLRHEALGSRTGRGRHVSRWYLADELEFLREHMATDTRVPYSFLHMDDMKFKSEPQAESPPFGAPSSPAPVAGEWGSPEPASPPAITLETLSQEQSLSQEQPPSSPPSPDSCSFFPFFGGLRPEYRQLSVERRRQFRRACLASLHSLLDEQDQQDQQTAQHLEYIEIIPHIPEHSPEHNNDNTNVDS